MAKAKPESAPTHQVQIYPCSNGYLSFLGELSATEQAVLKKVAARATVSPGLEELTGFITAYYGKIYTPNVKTKASDDDGIDLVEALASAYERY